VIVFAEIDEIQLPPFAVSRVLTLEEELPEDIPKDVKSFVVSTS
jgi:hypothetical protein